MLQLMRVDDQGADRIRDEIEHGDKTGVPGAVRISLGIGANESDIDAAAEALASIAADGPRWTYQQSRHSGEYEPYPDPRPLPDCRSASPIRQSTTSASPG